ncbi:pyruvate, water dikinase regulatory protein [Curtanaerobium respiraculi]|uniref:pyruvate, water dikinase regulatory protein n=1 Tax=Curtanaerobium respiraculi TaxID=2949669 RepID=UPI0024B3571E|nr:pyruvate, phosphate dikinase/phosphoenolpyruvate synthase regulator [Curtanaerobium respiraculi]
MGIITYGNPCTLTATIHVISDSVGTTATAIARAAASQFGEPDPRIELYSNATFFENVRDWLLDHSLMHGDMYKDPRMVVYYTVAQEKLHSELVAFFDTHNQFAAVDLLTGPVRAISRVSERLPYQQAGMLHVTDERYFNRLDAVRFTIAHDDGRNPQDLPKADIVLLGVSRSGKTPTSIYLAQDGFRVANVPLDSASEPPEEIYQVQPARLFGLMTSVEVLAGVRKRRIGSGVQAVVAANYTDPIAIAEDLENAHALMRKLGCIVIRTDNRAVEETAQEVLRYLEAALGPIDTGSPRLDSF